MKCQHCSRAIKFWQPNCPGCGKPLPPRSYSTIAETTSTPEQQSRRRLLQQVLQFALLALTFIAIASLIRLDPPKANPLPQENLRAAVSSTPAPAAEAVTNVAAPAVSAEEPVPPPPPMPAAKLAPISLFSAADLRLAGNNALPLVAVRPPISASSKKARLATPSADEAKPRKVTTPPAIGTAAPIVPPPVTAAEPKPEAPKLEVEATGVLLHPNTGLVTINSYVPARVYIDGVYSGQTPRSVKLLAGEHSISLLAAGYHEYSRKIKVQGQQQVGILAAMSKK